jgi:hypothetical protein
MVSSMQWSKDKRVTFFYVILCWSAGGYVGVHQGSFSLGKRRFKAVMFHFPFPVTAAREEGLVPCGPQAELHR